MQENKKQKRVSFAAEEPERNMYEREQTFNSITTDDITADITIDQTRIRNSFFDETKICDFENDEKNEICEFENDKKKDICKFQNDGNILKDDLNNHEVEVLKNQQIGNMANNLKLDEYNNVDLVDNQYEFNNDNLLDINNVNNVDEMNINKKLNINTFNNKNTTNDNYKNINNLDEFNINDENLFNDNKFKFDKIITNNKNFLKNSKIIDHATDYKKTSLPLFEDNKNIDFEKNNSFMKSTENLNKKTSINNNENIFNKSSFIEDKENETVMSNTTVVFDELITTQYIRNIVQPKNKPSINLNEVLMEMGIRFLDDIVVSSTRRETLSKSRKDIDPALINYYRYFLVHRIAFFDNFSEYIKDNLLTLQDSIKNIELNFDIKGTLLETNDKSNLRSLKTDCRNRATVSWYDIRTKKELEFNEMIINKKNELISILNNKEMELNKLMSKKKEAQQTFEDLDYKLKNITSEIASTNISESSISQLNNDILDHEKVLESYKLELNKLEEQYNTKKLKEDMEERKVIELKNEIKELEKQFKNSNISEDDLNRVRNEYEKTISLLGLNFIEYSSEKIKLEFLNTYIINLTKDNIQIECKSNDGICLFSKCIFKDLQTFRSLNKIGFSNKSRSSNENELTNKSRSSQEFNNANKTEFESNVNTLNKNDSLRLDNLNLESNLNVTELTNNFYDLKDILYTLNLLHEFYKELQIVKDFVSTETYIKNDKLYINLLLNDIQNMKTTKISVELKPNMEVLIEKNGEKFMYNLYFNKGALLDHVI